MTVFCLYVVMQILEAVVTFFTLRWVKDSYEHRILRSSPRLPTKLPIIDSYLSRKAGMSSKRQRWMAHRMAKLCQRFAHTRAFEHVLEMIINPDSALRRRGQKPQRALVEVVL